MSKRAGLPILLRSPEVIEQKIDNDVKPGKLVFIKIPRPLRSGYGFTFQGFVVGFCMGVDQVAETDTTVIAKLFGWNKSRIEGGRVLYILFGEDAYAFLYGKVSMRMPLLRILTREQFKGLNDTLGDKILTAVPMFR